MAYGLVDLVSNDPNIEIGIATWASSPPILRRHHPGNRIVIGKFCCLGSDVSIFAGGTHPMSHLTQHHLKLYLGVGDFENWSAQCGDRDDLTSVGNDVWIGDGALILTGVTVGDGAVIGARAVVNRDVPPYAIVAGNRAEVIRYRFDPGTIEKLVALRWWDWPEDDLKDAADILFSEDIDQLVAFAHARGLCRDRKNR